MIETYMQMDNKVTCIVLMQLLYMYVASTHCEIAFTHVSCSQPPNAQAQTQIIVILSSL